MQHYKVKHKHVCTRNKSIIMFQWQPHIKIRKMLSETHATSAAVTFVMSMPTPDMMSSHQFDIIRATV